MKAKKRGLLRLLIPAGFILLASVVAWKLGYFDIDHRDRLVSLAKTASGSPMAMLLFAGAYIAVILLCLPATILIVVAGALFGALKAGVLVWVAAMIGTLAAYWIARSVGRKTVERLFGRHRLFERLRNETGLRGLIAMRAVPLGPFGVLPYVAGLAKLPLRRLLIATAIGDLASIIAYSFAGSRFRLGLETDGPEAKQALLIAGGITVGIIIFAGIAAWMNHRGNRKLGKAEARAATHV